MENNKRKKIYGVNIVSDTIAPDHFLKKVFKKKEGGTAVGNIIRIAANKATGGIIGTGANRLPVQTKPINTGGISGARKQLIDKTKAQLNAEVNKIPAQLRDQISKRLTDAEMLPKTKATKDVETAITNASDSTTIERGIKFNQLYIVGVVVVIVIAFFALRK